MPKPFLTREEANERLITLGFKLGEEVLNYPPGYQKPMFIALQELIMGAIADWAEPEEEPGDNLDAELREWTEEWLVG